jgi:hypothetical protein
MAFADKGDRLGNPSVRVISGGTTSQTSSARNRIPSVRSFSKRGPCGEGSYPLVDANGDTWEFRFQSFCNSYELLTFATVSKRLSLVVGG